MGKNYPFELLLSEMGKNYPFRDRRGKWKWVKITHTSEKGEAKNG